MHRRSLERFAFDSVLFPYNFTMMGIPQYASEVEALIKLCNERGIAVQTIKSAARRRWQNGDDAQIQLVRAAARARSDPPRGAFHAEPAGTVPQHHRATRPSSPNILDAASETATEPTRAEMEADVAHYAMEPLFIPGVRDRI